MQPQYKTFLLTLVPLLALVTVVLYWLEQEERASTLQVVELQESRRVRVSAQFMTRDFAPAVADLQILASGEPLREFLAAPGPATRTGLARHFILFSRERRVYDQIRLLSPEGREMCRVDYRDGAAVQIPGNELQDKSHRYYFQQAASLPPGGIYISPLDLNIERGKIERPLKPMLRFATPVYTSERELAGVLVLNYLASVMLERVLERLREAPDEAMILNPDGRILVSRSGEHDWGFMWGDRWRFADAYATEWQRLQGLTGQFISEEGLFTFASAHPLLGLGTGEAWRPPGVSLRTLQGEDPRAYYWTVLSLIHHDRLDALVTARSQNYLPLYLLGWMMSALVSMSYSYVRVNRQRRRASDRLAARVMDISRDAVVITDRERRIVRLNHAFSVITGFLPGEVIGQELRAFHASHYDPEGVAEIWRHLEQEGRWRGEVKIRRKDGSHFIAVTTIAVLRGGEDSPSNYVETFSDITEHKAREEVLTRQAQYDALTGLPNRHLFSDRLDMALAGAQRHQDRVALLFVDLNQFKPVNDRFGHEAGDRVLCRVAERLLRIAHRHSDTVARLGGDEFVVLLAAVDSPRRAHEFAHEVEQAISEPMDIFVGEPVRVGASVGVAVYPDQAGDAQSLIDKADRAMYAIKRGR